ncbi:MAG: glycosyltransferase family 4 protein [Alphaproteobacteria bacterium]
MIRVALILPSLANRGPVIVANELARRLAEHGHICTVYYFDDIQDLDFPCKTIRIKESEKIDFEKYDVIHSHGMRPDKYIYKNKPKHKISTLFISTLHNYIFEDLKYQYNLLISIFFGRLWINWLSRHDIIVTLSQHAVEYYRRRISAEKLTFVFNSRTIDSSKSLSQDERLEVKAFKGESTLIGVNSLLTPRKGVDLLISNLHRLPEYRLFIVGTGKSQKHLEKLADKCGVANRCYFAGYRKDAYRYLGYYDILAMPSRSEGFGLSLLEAAYYQVPVVASDIPIFKEIFTSDEVSFFNLNNPSTIVNAIHKATSNEDMANKMNRKYREKYSPEMFYEQYLKIYNGEF